MTKHIISSTRILVVLGLSGTPLAAQQIFPDTAAAEISRLLRTKGISGRALQLLRQEHGSQPRNKLDAIADSLTSIAIYYPGDSVRHMRVRIEALDVLAASGKAGRGIPYQGATSHLLQIALSESQLRAGAVFALTQIANQGLALQSLRQVAVSRAGAAYVAIGHLARDMGPQGLAIARQIYLQDSVREPRARQDLEGLARYYGW